MWLRTSATALIASCVVAICSGAGTAQVPGSIPSIFSVPSGEGVYFTLNGQATSVGLPDFKVLGSSSDSASGAARSANDVFRLRAEGSAVSGAIGYVFGNAPAYLGGNLRIRLGGSYFEGDTSKVNPRHTLSRVFVSSLPIPACLGSCAPQVSLALGHRAWQANAVVESDFRFGPLTLSPMIAAFGGSARTNQQTWLPPPREQIRGLIGATLESMPGSQLPSGQIRGSPST